MASKDKVIKRIDDLVRKGHFVSVTRIQEPPNVVGSLLVDFEVFHEWQTQSIAYLSKILGPDHTYVQRFKDKVEKPYWWHVKTGIGILEAIKDDIREGCLAQIEAHLSAHIYSDFLDMAENLLERGHKVPAAALIGAVLEGSLRTICEINKIKISSDESASSLNNKLSMKEVYDPVISGKVKSWNEVHKMVYQGKFDDFGTDDVSDMLKGVRMLLEQYLY